MCIHNNIKVHQSKAQYNIALIVTANGLWVQWIVSPMWFGHGASGAHAIPELLIVYWVITVQQDDYNLKARCVVSHLTLFSCIYSDTVSLNMILSQQLHDIVWLLWQKVHFILPLPQYTNDAAPSSICNLCCDRTCIHAVFNYLNPQFCFACVYNLRCR